MYTVVVADDEEEIRKGIIKKVRWEELGFRVVGDAENGVEALELVEKLEPDLLLTDIRMPFMSGIELARQVREIRPTVQIAFLSGFDDFSYAQQAIQYNIISYMLKPISSQELEEELKNIKEIIDRKFEEFASKESVQDRLDKSEFMLPLLLEGYQGKVTEEVKEELRQNALSCGLLGSSDPEVYRYVVMVTSISDQEKDHTTRASVQAIDMILKKYVRSVSCYMPGRVVSILSATEGGFQKYLHIIVDEIVQSVARIMKMQGTVGVSRSTDCLAECRECYLEAMDALSYSRQRESNVHFIADEERGGYVSQDITENTISQMEELLRGGSTEEIRGFLQDFTVKIASGEIAPAVADFLLTQMTAATYKVLYTVAGEGAVEHLQENFQLTSHNLVEQIMDSYEKYISLCIGAKELISEQRKKSGEVLCERALKLIETHYSDPELSIVSVSAEIAVSPNYLSALLKKTTGHTFVEILTARRIEKATELLTCTAKKIREITEECGYRDQHYFSYCFKKATGMSPNQCRKEKGIA